MTTFCKDRSRAARPSSPANEFANGTARISKTAFSAVAKKTGVAVFSAPSPRRNHLNQILIGFRAFSAHWRGGLHPGFAVSSAA
ncbi:MAG: hypothetical protein EBS68_10355 [Rhodobacteraceae bacterium]|nr:hypothetical protein [Paracoccaceae bacterium]